MISSQAVQDNVNKYRHGVLIGNYNEQQFGLDSVNRGRQDVPTNVSTMRATHKLENSLHRFHPVITPQDKRTQTFYGFTGTVNDKALKQPEKQTTYDIFFRHQFPRRVPIVENNCKKQQRLDKEKVLFDVTKTQLENTSFRKTTGKFHYRKNYNDPVLEGERGQAGIQRLDGNGEGLDGRTGDDLDQNGAALNGALNGQNQNDDQLPLGVGTNKIGPIRAKSLNPSRLSSLLSKAQQAKIPKKNSKDNQSNIKLGDDEDEGQQSHILFGHGLTVDRFHERQFATTYDLSYNQKIKPVTQINSFFKPDLTRTAKQFHRDTFYQKNHQVKIPEFSSKIQLYNDKICRPYAPFTKQFDLKHMKTPYLRK